MKKENREILHSVIDLIEHAEAMEVKYLKALDTQPATDTTRSKIASNAIRYYFKNKIKPYFIPSPELRDDGSIEGFPSWLKRVAERINVPDNVSRQDIVEFYRESFMQIYRDLAKEVRDAADKQE